MRLVYGAPPFRVRRSVNGEWTGRPVSHGPPPVFCPRIFGQRVLPSEKMESFQPSTHGTCSTRLERPPDLRRHVRFDPRTSTSQSRLSQPSTHSMSTPTETRSPDGGTSAHFDLNLIRPTNAAPRARHDQVPDRRGHARHGPFQSVLVKQEPGDSVLPASAGTPVGKPKQGVPQASDGP